MDTDNKNPSILLFSEIVEANGKTIRENNMEQKHLYPIGEVVEVDLDLSQPGCDDGIDINLKGVCTLYVTGHNRDCDGTPLYIISDIPVEYPISSPSFSQERLVYRTLAKVVEHGYGEESLRPVGRRRDLAPNSRAWLMPTS